MRRCVPWRGTQWAFSKYCVLSSSRYFSLWIKNPLWFLCASATWMYVLHVHTVHLKHEGNAETRLPPPSPVLPRGCWCSHSFKHQGWGPSVYSSPLWVSSPHPAPAPCPSYSYPMPLTSENNSFAKWSRDSISLSSSPPFSYKCRKCRLWVLASEVQRPQLESGLCHFLAN